MIDTLDTIMSEYYQNMEIYKKLKYDVGEIITTLIDINHIKISNMTLRIKSEEALKNKVISKAKYNHLDEITDILGCRIVTLFESDVDKIFDLIDKTFEIVEIVDKRKKHKVNNIEFGYTSLHLVVKFTDERCQLVEYQKYQDILFEIQLRTVLQHAWAEVEHGLGYKSFYEPPMEIKRKLNRLAATLEILDEEFEDIRYGIALYNQSLDKEEKVLKTDINKDSLIAYVNSSPTLNEMAQAIAGKFHYQIVRDPHLISQQKLVAKMNFYGYQYINELNDDIIRHQETIQTIGEELSSHINYDSPTLNLYSTLLWFSFIPVIKNLIAGHGASSEEILDDVIIETFRNSSLSIFDVFNPKKLNA
ncbi:MAG: hypothetical protein KHX56_05035 [Clostridiales bacterium]|nr:hypothetical protein [Clostridiales bacterium]